MHSTQNVCRGRRWPPRHAPCRSCTTVCLARSHFLFEASQNLYRKSGYCLTLKKSKWGLKKDRKMELGGGEGGASRKNDRINWWEGTETITCTICQVTWYINSKTTTKEIILSYLHTNMSCTLSLSTSPPNSIQTHTHTCMHTNTHTIHPPSDWGCSLVSICTAKLVVTASSRSIIVFKSLSAVTTTSAPAHTTTLMKAGQANRTWSVCFFNFQCFLQSNLSKIVLKNNDFQVLTRFSFQQLGGGQAYQTIISFH